MIAISAFRRLAAPVVPVAARRATAGPAAPAARQPDRLETSRPTSARVDPFRRVESRSGTGGSLTSPKASGSKEAVVAQLAKSNAGLTWAAEPGEKLRVLASLAKLRTDAAADVLMAGFAAASPTLPPVREAALARTFQALLAPDAGGLSPAKRDEALAFVLKRFHAAAPNGDTQLQLGFALALSGSEAGADALIAHYRQKPVTGSELVHRPLHLLTFSPHPKVAAFLAAEAERVGGLPNARQQVLSALVDQLDRAAF